MTSLQFFLWQISSIFRILKGNIFIGVCICQTQKFWTAVLQRQRKWDSFRKISQELLKFSSILFFLSISRMYRQCSPVVGCRLDLCNCINREFHYIRFPDNFPKFFAQRFQNTLVKSSVIGFSRVLGCRLQSCLILKDDCIRDNFLKFLEVKLTSRKSM